MKIFTSTKEQMIELRTLLDENEVPFRNGEKDEEIEIDNQEFNKSYAKITKIENGLMYKFGQDSIYNYGN